MTVERLQNRRRLAGIGSGGDEIRLVAEREARGVHECVAVLDESPAEDRFDDVRVEDVRAMLEQLEATISVVCRSSICVPEPADPSPSSYSSRLEKRAAPRVTLPDLDADRRGLARARRHGTARVPEERPLT